MQTTLRHLNPRKIAPPAHYSHAVEASSIGRILFVSGQVGTNPDGTVADGISEQTKAAIENLRAVLAEAGMDVSDVVKFTIYLTDASLLEGFVGAGAGPLSSPPPATTLLYVKALASPQLLVEIEAIAVG